MCVLSAALVAALRGWCAAPLLEICCGSALVAVCWYNRDTRSTAYRFPAAQLGFFARAACVLVSYMASMFLSRRLCASNYVYFASLYDVCTQNELAFLGALQF